MPPRPVFIAKSIFKLTCGISALVLVVMIFLNLRRMVADEYSGVKQYRYPQIVESLNCSRRPTDSKSRELWSRLVKRFWVLTKNLSTVEEPSDLLNYFINDDGFNLWGSCYQDRNINPTAFMDEDRILPQLVLVLEGPMHDSMRNAKMKKIYLNESFEWWHYNGDFANECPGLKTKCEFVEDMNNGLDAAITVRDAFHLGEINFTQSVARFVFSLESPIISSRELHRSNDMLTSYWTHSDLVTPYGKWVYYDPDVRRIPQAVNYAKGKTKMAAIMVSNCRARNNRLKYVKKLQMYIKVDIFGDCLGKTCPLDGSCFERLKKEYKFYLAFENANCRDYITEKFFLNAFSNNVVPVVMGAHPKDYGISAPENSYIHVQDFGSPKELANYLQKLDTNEEEYLKYFEWKGTGEFISTKFFCRVCAMLHYADFVPPPERLSTFSWAASNEKLCSSNRGYYWKWISQ